MKDSTPDCPPFTRNQLDRLEELKAEIEKRDALSALDPEMPKINERIDDLSVIVSRFALKNIPKESRRPGEFIIEVPTCGGRLLPGQHRLEIKPGFGIFHPDLPPWAENHFIKWIREHRAGFRRYDGREVLRETGIVGIETGMPEPPIKFEDIECWEVIKQRVLELRGVKDEAREEDDYDETSHSVSPPVSPAAANETPPYTLAEIQKDSLNRMRVTPEMLKNAKLQSKTRTEKKRKRTRKNFATWDMVIDKLVEEGLLTSKITHQAFKRALKNHFPDYPWDTV